MNNQKKSDVKAEVNSDKQSTTKYIKKQSVDNPKYVSKILKVNTDILTTEVDRILSKNRTSSSSNSKRIKNSSTTPQKKHTTTSTTPLQKKSPQIFKNNKQTFLSNKTLNFVKSSKTINPSPMNTTQGSQGFQMNSNLQTQSSQGFKLNHNNHTNTNTSISIQDNQPLETIGNFSTTANIAKSLKVPLDLHAKKASLCLNNFKNQTSNKNFYLPRKVEDLEKNIKKTNVSSTSSNTSLIGNNNSSINFPKQSNKQQHISHSNNRSINTTNINISFINKEKETKDIFKVLEHKLDDLLNSSQTLDEKRSFYIYKKIAEESCEYFSEDYKQFFNKLFSGLIENGIKIIDSNSKLKNDLDKQIKTNFKKKFKIGSETMKHYTSNIPREKDDIKNSTNFDQYKIKSSYDKNIKEISKDISEIKEKVDDKDEYTPKLNNNEDEVKFTKKIDFSIKGFNTIKDLKQSPETKEKSKDLKETKEMIKNKDFILEGTNCKNNNANNLLMTRSDSRNKMDSSNISKGHTDIDLIDLDSLYFVDKVNVRSKSFKVPKLNLNPEPQEIPTKKKLSTKNSVSIDLDNFNNTNTNNANHILQKHKSESYNQTKTDFSNSIKLSNLKNSLKSNNLETVI